MQSLEFVEPYRRTIPDQSLHKFGHSDIMGEARYWDNAYGEVLHDYLSTGSAVDTSAYSGNYLGFALSRLPHLPGIMASQGIPGEDKEKLLSELSFHYSNSAMYPMWFPMQDEGEWKSDLGGRREAIQFSQDRLSLTGLSMYLFRNRAASARNEYGYFGSDYDITRPIAEGVGSELDAALVLLEAIKPYDDLTVVAGPRQFESDGSRTVGVAADFVVASTEGKAIGVQVKSSVMHEEKISKYDPSRIMIIDARSDLGDHRIMRTQQESTRVRSVTWAGTLCAQRACAIKFYGKNPYFKYLAASGLPDTRVLQTMQAQGRQLTRRMSNELPRATEIIRDRMVRKLQEAPETQKPTIIDLAKSDRP